MTADHGTTVPTVELDEDDLDDTTLDDLEAAAETPYGTAALGYFTKGWSPLPMQTDRTTGQPTKTLQVTGYTGRAGQMATRDDVLDWVAQYSDRNVGLRVPEGVLGIDVDAYFKAGKQKEGGLTLAAWETEYGTLPRTWMSTSRTDGISGIRFFQVPEQDESEEWMANIPGDIEIIQFHHRYIVVSPSVNPLSGMQYDWISPDGEILGHQSAPRIEDLPHLPTEWVQALTKKKIVKQTAAQQPTRTRPVTEIDPRAQQLRDVAIARLETCKAGGDMWDENTFIAAKELLRLANSNWSGYSRTDARSDMEAHVPTDAGFPFDKAMSKYDRLVNEGFDEFIPESARNGKFTWDPPALQTERAAGAEAVNRMSGKQGGHVTSIQVEYRNDSELLDDTIKAILKYDGTEPRLFRSGNDLVALNPRTYELATLDQGALRTEVTKRTDFYVIREVKETVVGEDGEEKVVKVPKPRSYSAPKTLLESMLSSPDERLPECRTVLNTGFFTPSGDWWDREGYCSEAMVYCTGQVQSDPIPDNPTAQDVQDATAEIMKTIAEFPFVDTTSRTHALSMVLLPFVRHMIDGPTPLYLIQSPDAGTGKSLLMETMLYSAFGNISMADTPARKDEMVKATFAALRQAPQYLIMDNLQEGSTFGSQELAKILTSYPTHQGRVLGTSTTERVPTTCIWGATGNNPEYASDIARRAVGIELNAGRQVLGRTFAIKNLRGYLHENRAKLIAAAATIIRGWIQAGRPDWSGQKPLDSFESWTTIMGGITEFAGYVDFLGNQERLSQDNNARKNGVEELGAIWAGMEAHARLEGKVDSKVRLTGKQLLQLVEESMLDLGLTGHTEAQRLQSLGYALRDYIEKDGAVAKQFKNGMSIMKARTSQGMVYVLAENEVKF